MNISEFDFDLPEDLIAQTPAAQRDESRLLVVDRAAERLQHRIFRDLTELLRPGDCLVLNRSRVIPARLFARHATLGIELEILLLAADQSGNEWEALLRPGKKARVGDSLLIAHQPSGIEVRAWVTAKLADGRRRLRFECLQRPPELAAAGFTELLEVIGRVPLPPYIKRPADESDRDRYQTVYANSPGSIAAPTAGLHFTDELLRLLAGKGIQLATTVLHVGIGTFQPVRVDRIEEHRMHREYYRIEQSQAELLNSAKTAGARIIAVGTTAARVLETVAADGLISSGDGWTNIFIYPGYQFRFIDGLLTNFHLPRSTLLMLVYALMGMERGRQAYQEAVRQRYRFFSYGDAMLIV